MRSIFTTIDELLAIIPESEAELLASLEKEKADAVYTPPECQWECWRRTGYTLAKYMGDDGDKFNEWQRRVCDTFNGPNAKKAV